MNVYQMRLAQLREKMRERCDRGAVFFPSPNMYYMTGFHTFPGERLLLAVMPLEGEPFFIAPKLFAGQLRRSTWISEIITWTDEEDAYARFGALMESKGLSHGTFAVDDTTWAAQLLGLMRVLPAARFESVGPLMSSLRLRKSADEIARIQQASKIADDVVALLCDTLQPGMREVEIAALMEYTMRNGGASGPSFETIVGSGPNSALPHYNAGERLIQNGDFVVLDFGALYQGYCSDTTRTLAIGEPSPRMAEVYEVVRQAQEIGVQTARPGIRACEIDQAVRRHIASHGYGEYFTHRTGHGLGMEVHEDPYINAINEQILEPGMVFSIEPGIYIEGEFGVRIEDIVYLTETGCERFNHSRRELTIVGA